MGSAVLPHDGGRPASRGLRKAVSIIDSSKQVAAESTACVLRGPRRLGRPEHFRLIVDHGE